LLQIVPTHDGSSTLLSETFQSHYHSIFGAETESTHIFIEHGLIPALVDKTSIQVFEFGFGTGLNALLALLFAAKNPSKEIRYTTVEAYPVPNELLAGLRYDFGSFLDEFYEMHQSESGKILNLLPNFEFQKFETTFETCKNHFTEPFDLIFYDAFAPQIQPELWTEDFFKSLPIKTGGTMVTFCAQGAARRAMKAAGFSIEKLAGPPGKREMTRATRL
jgi:tRNA U34 5-methylaminomethyl-2-thiouridine-forming methyltransferase MnmC